MRSCLTAQHRLITAKESGTQPNKTQARGRRKLPPAKSYAVGSPGTETDSLLEPSKLRLTRLSPDFEADDPLTQAPIGPVYKAPTQDPSTRDLPRAIDPRESGDIPSNQDQEKQRDGKQSWTFSADQDVTAALEQLQTAEQDAQGKLPSSVSQQQAELHSQRISAGDHSISEPVPRPLPSPPQQQNHHHHRPPHHHNHQQQQQQDVRALAGLDPEKAPPIRDLHQNEPLHGQQLHSTTGATARHTDDAVPSSSPGDHVRGLAALTEVAIATAPARTPAAAAAAAAAAANSRPGYYDAGGDGSFSSRNNNNNSNTHDSTRSSSSSTRGDNGSAKVGSFFRSKSAMLQSLQIKQRQLLVQCRAKEASSKARYRYTVQDGLLVRVKQQQQQRTFPLVKLPPADSAIPTTIQDHWQQQQQQGQQTLEPHSLSWTEDMQPVPLQLPPPAAAAAATGAAAAAMGAAATTAAAAGDRPSTAGADMEATASDALVAGDYIQAWDETDIDFTKAEEEHEEEGVADAGDDLLSDMEVLAELLGDIEDAAAAREVMGQRRQQGQRGQERKQQQQQRQQQQEVVADDSLFDWRTAEPSQMQQYSQLLQDDGSGTSAAAGTTAGAGAAPLGRAQPATACNRPAFQPASGAAGGSPTYGLTLAVFVYCVPVKQLKRLLFELQLPLSCVRVVSRVSDADVVLHCLPQPGQRHFQYDAYRAQAKEKGIPFLSLRSISAQELARWFLPMFALYAGKVTLEEVTRRSKGGKGRPGRRYRTIKL